MDTQRTLAYVVMGTQGAYSDQRTWAACVSMDEERARDYAVKAEAEARRVRDVILDADQRLDKQMGCLFPSEIQGTRYDRHVTHGQEASYTVEKVEIDPTPGEDFLQTTDDDDEYARDGLRYLLGLIKTQRGVE